MAQYYGQQQSSQSPYGAQNLQFYQSSYPSQPPVSGQSTPFQASYGGQQSGYSGGSGGGQSAGFGMSSGGASSSAYGSGSGAGFGGFGGAPGVSGRMGEQGGLRTGWLAAFGTEGYEGEPPLLEELGVNFGHIKTKTLTVLNPIRTPDQHIMDDTDLAGPILFVLLFGFFLLFSGKVHFGYIYGLAIIGSTSLHIILSLMSPPPDANAYPQTTSPSGTVQAGVTMSRFGSVLTWSRSLSVLGYCLLPLVLTSLIGVVAPMDTLFGYILTSLAIVWCTLSSSAMFCAVGHMTNMRGLVAYPLGLFYVGFGIMSIFSSRGTGSLERTTGIS